MDHRDDVGKFSEYTIVGKIGTNLKLQYDGWKLTSCDYSDNLHKFALARSISQCPSVRGEYIYKRMLVDIKPSYKHGKDCNWRRGKVTKLDNYSGQIGVTYKDKQMKFLLWVHLDNKEEVAPIGTHTKKLVYML